jgi:hypothetical protein
MGSRSRSNSGSELELARLLADLTALITQLDDVQLVGVTSVSSFKSEQRRG